MSGFSFSALKAEYAQQYHSMVINSNRLAAVKSAAAKINKGKTKYQEVEKITNVPWYFIGMLHLRESDCDFNTHLHNGDPLAARTRHVPAGRPLTGTPPFSFEFSAVDALKIQGYTDIKDWSIERIAYCSEAFNGWGYRYRGFPSAYLWAGTNQYARGKFVSDGVFNPNVVDTQLGCMAVLKYLIDNYVDASTEIEPSEEIPISSPKATVDRPTDEEMNVVSRKHWWSDWMQWLGFGSAGATASYQAADKLDLEQTRVVVELLKQTVEVVGAVGLIALLIGLGIYFIYQKKLIKDDVVEGRAMPSGGLPNGEGK